MTIDERTRFEIRAYFRGAMGEDRLADALMEAIPAVDYGDLATKADLALTKADLRVDMADLRSDMSDLSGDMSELRSDMRTEMGGLRTELKMDISNVRSEMSLMERSLNGQFRTSMALTIGSTLSTWGLMATLFGVFG